jgi:hypothetical protein
MHSASIADGKDRHAAYAVTNDRLKPFSPQDGTQQKCWVNKAKTRGRKARGFVVGRGRAHAIFYRGRF